MQAIKKRPRRVNPTMSPVVSAGGGGGMGALPGGHGGGAVGDGGPGGSGGDGDGGGDLTE